VKVGDEVGRVGVVVGEDVGDVGVVVGETVGFEGAEVGLKVGELVTLVAENFITRDCQLKEPALGVY
jgi:hypothetical protein